MNLSSQPLAKIYLLQSTKIDLKLLFAMSETGLKKFDEKSAKNREGITLTCRTCTNFATESSDLLNLSKKRSDPTYPC